MYSPHVYGPAEYPQPWFNGQTTPASLVAKYQENWAFISESGMAPVWIGEFGAPNDVNSVSSTLPGSEGQWFQTLVEYLAQHREVGWTYWSLNGDDRYALLNGEYGAVPASPEKQALLARVQMAKPRVADPLPGATVLARASLPKGLARFHFHLPTRAARKETGPEITVVYDEPAWDSAGWGAARRERGFDGGSARHDGGPGCDTRGASAVCARGEFGRVRGRRAGGVPGRRRRPSRSRSRTRWPSRFGGRRSRRSIIWRRTRSEPLAPRGVSLLRRTRSEPLRRTRSELRAGACKVEAPRARVEGWGFSWELMPAGRAQRLCLADADRELARSVVGTIKLMRTDVATATANLEAALAALETQSGASMRDVASTCVGAAGYTVPLVSEWLTENFAARVGGRFWLAGDVEIALDAAFAGEPGVLVLAGTGSNVAGRLASGAIVTVGGWGPALSDQASGHNLGRGGLRAAVLEHDEHGRSALLDAILAHWGLASFQALVEFANRSPAPDVSQLSPIVVGFAEAGDQAALGVLEREAVEMAHLAAVVARQVRGGSDGRSGRIGGQARLAFAGSIMEHVPLMRDRIVSLVRQELPGTDEVPGVAEPVRGALWRARARS